MVFEKTITTFFTNQNSINKFEIIQNPSKIDAVSEGLLKWNQWRIYLSL